MYVKKIVHSVKPYLFYHQYITTLTFTTFNESKYYYNFHSLDTLTKIKT